MLNAAPRDPATLLAAARLYYLEGRSQAEIATQHGHQPVERLPDAHARPRSRASSRSGSTTRPAGSTSSRRRWPTRSACATSGSRTPGLVAGLPDRGPGRHPGGPAAARQPQGLDDRRAVVGPRAPVDGLRDDVRPRAPPAHAGPAGRRPLLDQQRDQRPGAGPRARRPPRRRLPLPARAGHPGVRPAPATRCWPSRRSPTPWPRPAAPTSPSSASARPSHGSSSAILDSLNLSAAERKEFWAAEPVGDIAARYYDAAGQPIHGAVEERILGIALEDLVVHPARGRGRARAGQGPRRARCPARPPHRLPGVRRDPRPQPAQRGAPASAADTGGT